MGEADEIITVLLADHGLQKFFVGGSRKSKKRFRGVVDHFSRLKMEYKSKDCGLMAFVAR